MAIESRGVASACRASGIRGFQISALASPLISWSTIVEEFKVANRLAGEGDPSQLKVFVNTRLAEPYVEAEARMSEDELLVRLEEYQAEVPDRRAASRNENVALQNAQPARFFNLQFLISA